MEKQVSVLVLVLWLSNVCGYITYKVIRSQNIAARWLPPPEAEVKCNIDVSCFKWIIQFENVIHIKWWDLH